MNFKERVNKLSHYPKRYFPLLVLSFFALFSYSNAFAHSMPPSLLQIEEGQKTINLLWKTARKHSGFPMSPQIPDGCHFVAPPALTSDDISARLQGELDCGANGLAGKTIAITNIEKNITPVIFRYKALNQEAVSGLLNADQPTFVVPDTGHANDSGNVILDFIKHGVTHLLIGYDHMLFVIALVLLMSRTVTLIQAVTCFTVGHSVSLALSTLNIISVNVLWVEVFIAASITIMAAEIVTKINDEKTLKQSGNIDPNAIAENSISFFERYVWVVATAFGTLHGLGFATVLADLQLPQGELFTALFSFNVGIEIGQLLIIAVCFLLKLIVALMKVESATIVVQAPRYLAYSFGCLSAFWVLERAQLIFLGS